MKNAAMFVFVVLAAAIAAHGADYYVSPGNAGAQAPYATWETAAATIEDAMALAVLDKGCTVTLDDGVYELAEMLCVTNTMTLTSRNGRAHTFIEPGANFPADTRLCMVKAPTKTAADRPVVSGITFRNATINTGYGAGVFVRYPGGVVQDCRITGCKMLTQVKTAIPSGALCGSTGTFIYRCIIDNNEARWENPDSQYNVSAGVAGITFVEDGANSITGGPDVENCLVVHNYGPAISYNNFAHSKPVFRNCTAVDNGGGAGLYHLRESTFVNCIFLTATTLPQKRGDGIKTSDNFNRGATTWSHCYYNSLGGSYASGRATWTDNVVGFDPKFVNPRAMDYRLRADSPCRGKGAAWDGDGTTDLDGNTIPSEGSPDIGCYQYDPNHVPEESILYVATTGDDANDGSDAAHAFATIPAAYAAATDGTEIRVGPGTYTLDETLVLDKKVTIIGAGIDKSFITTSGPFRPVSLENDFTLMSGFTFADIPYDGPQVWNGGVLENCRVTRCLRTDAGSNQGFVRVRHGCVNRCVIDSNTNLHGNISYAVFLTSFHPVTTIVQPAGFMLNSLVYGNRSRNASSSAVYLHRNSTSNGGVMRDCTVACNDMPYAVSRTSYGLQIANRILRDRDNGETKCWTDGGASVPADRWLNNCTPVEVGTSCVTNNPLFKNAAKGNFNLLPSSPCVGVATPVAWLMDALDLNGRPRVAKDGTQDIGCYQLLPPFATTISVR